jgi:hypothetical protein
MAARTLAGASVGVVAEPAQHVSVRGRSSSAARSTVALDLFRRSRGCGCVVGALAAAPEQIG